MSNYYIYCITGEIVNMENINFIGQNGENIEVVSYSDICAIASKTSFTHYEPNLENLQSHERVIKSIMEESTVLPLMFSTICKDKEAVVEILEKYYIQFKNNLERVEGKVELGIKIFHKLGYEKEVKSDKSKSSNPKEYITLKYARYLERKRQDEAIIEVSKEIHFNLLRFSSESCYSNPMKNNLIFNGSYLVDKYNIQSFADEVSRLKEKYPQYKIIYSGPWSPYHFVKIVKEGENIE